MNELATENLTENSRSKERKDYAIQGYKIAGRIGFQRIAALALDALGE